LQQPSDVPLLLLLLRLLLLIEKWLAVLPLLLLLLGALPATEHAATGARRTPAVQRVSMIASWPW
jgi:hypothetical protein